MGAWPRRSDDPTVYPESDGQPMADNTEQFRWIVVLKENLDAALPDFVAGDLLWYPVKGDPRTRAAPDALVALGRPKGPRPSYLQWLEGDVAPQVVFEVLSPSNSAREMQAKRAFYERHGVCEFYIVDPDVESLEIYLRGEEGLREVPFEGAFTSPRLGVRFERSHGRLRVFRPDGEPFRTFADLLEERDAVAAERDAVVERLDRVALRLDTLALERDTAAAERDAAAAERDAATAERDAATAERDAATAERDAAATRAARLAERLRALGIDPDGD